MGLTIYFRHGLKKTAIMSISKDCADCLDGSDYPEYHKRLDFPYCPDFPHSAHSLDCPDCFDCPGSLKCTDCPDNPDCPVDSNLQDIPDCHDSLKCTDFPECPDCLKCLASLEFFSWFIA